MPGTEAEVRISEGHLGSGSEPLQEAEGAACAQEEMPPSLTSWW